MTTLPENVTLEDDGTTKVEMDLLVNMFMNQIRHRREYDDIYRANGHNPPAPGQWGNVHSPQVQDAIRESIGYCVEELFEAAGHLKNKKWKTALKPVADVEAFYNELADAWHFWLEIMIYAGMTPDLIAKHYFGESKKNDDRKAEGY